MKITITPSTLCNLCNGHFSLEACEAICNYFEECGDDFAPSIGDICVSFAEIPASWDDEWNDDNTVAFLDNGAVVILH